MTVKEVRDKLGEYPDDMPVIWEDAVEENHCPVETVEPTLDDDGRDAVLIGPKHWTREERLEAFRVQKESWL